MAETSPAQFLYMLDEDLYRLANASSPRVTNLRPHDADIYERNGIPMIRANGKGISLITESRLKRERSTGYVWKLPANFLMPQGLALYPDTYNLNPGQPVEHYLLCPDSDMTVAEYVALLSKLALHFERIRKI